MDPGGAAGARLPTRDPILSFSHTFFAKSTRVRGRRPTPPTGYPGSATDSKVLSQNALEHTLLCELHTGCTNCKVHIDVVLYKIHLDEH